MILFAQLLSHLLLRLHNKSHFSNEKMSLAILEVSNDDLTIGQNRSFIEYIFIWLQLLNCLILRNDAYIDILIWSYLRNVRFCMKFSLVVTYARISCVDECDIFIFPRIRLEWPHLKKSSAKQKWNLDIHHMPMSFFMWMLFNF